MIKLEFKNFIKKNYEILLILILGGFLRFFRLTRLSIWEDESYFIYFTQRFSFAELLSFNYMDPSHPQSEFLLFKIYTNLFGIEKFLVRLPFVIFGIISIFLVYLIAKKLFNKKIGLLSSFLFAISPFHIYLSQETRPYTFHIMISLIAILFLVNYIKFKRNKDLNLAFLFAIIASYFHYFGLFIVAFISAYTLYLNWAEKTDIKRWFRIQIYSFIGTLPLIFMIFHSRQFGDITKNFFSLLEIPYLFMVFSIGETGLIFKTSTLHQDLIKNLPYLLICFIILACILISSLKTLVKNIKLKKTSSNKNYTLVISYFLIPLIITIIVSFVTPLFRPRYLSGILPAYLIILSLGLNSINKKRLKILLVAGLIFITSISLYNYYFTYEREPWEGISRYIEKNEKTGQIILGTEKWSFIYSYKGNLTHLGFWQDYQNITNKEVWLVYSKYNQGQIKEKQEIKKWLDDNYKLVSYKEFRDDSNEVSGNMFVYLYSK